LSAIGLVAPSTREDPSCPAPPQPTKKKGEGGKGAPPQIPSSQLPAHVVVIDKNMEVSAQLVTVSSKAPGKLVEAIAGSLPEGESAKFQEECSNLVAEAKAPELIRKLLAHRDIILSFEGEQDVEGCFGVLFALLYKTSRLETDLPALAEDIAAAVLEKYEGAESRAPLRLRMATNLCNILPTRSQVQFEVLLKIIGYAALSGLLLMLSSFFEGVEEWLQDWDLSLSDQRRLYLLIADVQERAGDDTATQKFLLKYLATYDMATAEGGGGGDATLQQGQVRQAAARAAIGAVKAPIESFMQQRNVLGMSAVRQLETDPEFAKAHELLRIFSEEKLAAYLTFASTSSPFLAKHSINNDECVANMRLLSLCSLATEKDEIPYSLVAETLKIATDEVEDWVLKACSAGLMDARMDQLEQMVLVSQYTSRVFGVEQWKNLQAKLRLWDANVSSLLTTIRRSNAAAAAVLGGM
jgi:translation initiation factor 3 subunit M